ncbi:MAG: YihY/virulence factor BrkB family protein [Clostridia bacterium]|nr:YihY/virulence factor BrkB family protein [Clostridia bacterium]
MGKIKKLYLYLRKQYDLLSLKKFTTIAGTLVFFLIMSITPLSFWLTLLVGRLPISGEEILSLPIFETVKDVFLFVQKEAASATTGASIILIFTTLYSATNLFYQMRRSGEIIYDFHQKRQGLKIRLGALLLMFIVMMSVVVFLGLFAMGSFLFSRILSSGFELIADYALLMAVSFVLVLVLNVYICPHKVKLKTFLPGTIITVILWVGAVIGFTIYLKIGNVTRLYGALSTLIIFLLWLYILMICFIVGVIFNSENVAEEHKKRR